MSAAQMYLVKQLLKAFGLNADDLENKLLEGQKIVMEFDMNDLKSGLQTILDYRENQAQNEMRLIAILNHFGIVDPVILSQIQLKENPDA